jgi:hypothetical protein
MKKIILSIIFAMVMSFGANAQIDAMVTDWDNTYRTTMDEMPWLPAVIIGINSDLNACDTPLGSGLLIFTALGAGYILRKKKNNKK